MPGLVLQDLRRLRNLRSLAISKLNGQSIGPEDFLEYGYELEDLKIYKAGLKIIRNNAFREVRTIKRLDLSENHINTIENDAFKEVGHSLTSLRISRGLSMDSVPVAPLKALKSLEELDLTNNRLSKVQDTSFHNLKNLRIVEMHDNLIDQLSKGTFQVRNLFGVQSMSLEPLFFREIFIIIWKSYRSPLTASDMCLSTLSLI